MNQKTRNELTYIADYLRKNIVTIDAIAVERRVDIFEGKTAISVLLDDKFKKSLEKKISEIPSTAESAKLLMKRLVICGYLVKANVIGNKPVPLTAIQQATNNAETLAGGSKENIIKPAKILIVEPDPVTTWSDEAYYIWIYEGSKVFIYIYSFGLLAITFIMVMYPLWPSSLRLCSWYLSMIALGLIGALFLLAIVRLTLYIVSKPFSPGFWLFPNLFEDVGFIDSFKPLYGWEAPPLSKKPALEETTNKKDQ